MLFPDENTDYLATDCLQLNGCNKHNPKILVSRTGYIQNQLAKIAMTLEPYKIAQVIRDTSFDKLSTPVKFHSVQG